MNLLLLKDEEHLISCSNMCSSTVLSQEMAIEVSHQFCWLSAVTLVAFHLNLLD